jgi:hypothetical protein
MEYTEWQWPLPGLHSIMMIKSEDGGCTLSPFHSIYHREQSCGVRSRWEGKYTAPISHLPLYLLCGLTVIVCLLFLYFSSVALWAPRPNSNGSLSDDSEYNAAVTFGSKVASECLCRLSFWVNSICNIVLNSAEHVLAGFRKKFLWSHAGGFLKGF